MKTKRGSWFRNMILGFVDSWIEGISIILLIAVIAGTWALCSNGEIGWGISVLCLGFLIVSLASWMFFCVADARETLHQIADNTAALNKEEETEQA